MPWTLRAEPVEFAQSAPAHFHFEIELDAPPDKVFSVFADIDSWARWYDDFRSARWTSEAKGGAGSTRIAVLGAATVDETFLVWEPGKRLSFRVETITLPLVHAMVEDWRLEPLPGGRTKLSWWIGYAPNWLCRLIHPIVRAIFGRQFQRTLAGLQAYVRG